MAVSGGDTHATIYLSVYYWDNEVSGRRVTWRSDAADLANAAAKPFSAALASGYCPQKWGTERGLTDSEEAYDYPVLRYAEVLLNYAEAVFEKNGTIAEADLDKSLNLVRNRVNKTMPKLSNALVTTNGLSMRDEIHRERNIELFFEGFRIDDVKGWKTAETESIWRKTFYPDSFGMESWAAILAILREKCSKY